MYNVLDGGGDYPGTACGTDGNIEGCGEGRIEVRYKDGGDGRQGPLSWADEIGWGRDITERVCCVGNGEVLSKYVVSTAARLTRVGYILRSSRCS